MTENLPTAEDEETRVLVGYADDGLPILVPLSEAYPPPPADRTVIAFTDANGQPRKMLRSVYLKGDH